MVCNHLGSLVLDSCLCMQPEIPLYKARKFILSFLFALKHDSCAFEPCQNLLSSVNSAVFIANHKNSCLCRFFKILLQLIPILNVLSFLYYNHLSLSHHRIAPRHISYLYGSNVGTKHNLLIKITFFRLQGMLSNKV